MGIKFKVGEFQISTDIVFLVFTMFSMLCLSSEITTILVISLVLLATGLIRFILFRKYPLSNGFVRVALWYAVFWAIVFVNGFFLTRYTFSWETLIIYMIPHIAIGLFFGRGYSNDIILSVFKRSCKYTAVISMIYIFLIEVTKIGSSMFRMGATVSNPNHIAMGMVIFLAVALYERMFEKQQNLVYIIALIIFIILTGSKKGLLGIFVVLMLLSIQKYKWHVLRYIIPIIAIIGLYYLIMNNGFLYGIIGRRVDAFFSDIGSSKMSSTTERIGMYQYGWSSFLRSPILGYGYNFFRYTSGYDTYSHSNYIEILVSFGLVGALSFYNIFLSLIFRSIKAHSNVGVLIFTLTITELVMETAAVNYYGFTFMSEVVFFAYLIIRNTGNSKRSTEDDVGSAKLEYR